MNDRALPVGDRDEAPPPRRPGESHMEYIRRLAIEEHGLQEDRPPRVYYEPAAPPEREPGQEG